MNPVLYRLMYFRTRFLFRLVSRVRPLEPTSDATPSPDHHSSTHTVHPTSQSDGYPYLAAALHGNLLTLGALEGLGCPADWGHVYGPGSRSGCPPAQRKHTCSGAHCVVAAAGGGARAAAGAGDVTGHGVGGP